jgi:hypothetical protein
MTIRYNVDMRKFFAATFLVAFLAVGFLYLTPHIRAAVVHDVPFTTQAPLGNWYDTRQQYGCEEASLLMAYQWATGAHFSPEESELLITGMADYEQYFWGFNFDTSAADTAKLYREFFGRSDVQVIYDVIDEDLVFQLDSGNVVLVPVNASLLDAGQSRRGPVRHMVVVLGYDGNSEEFIVHDPLYHSGANLRYGRKALEAALRDYPSGTNRAVTQHRRAMIVISRDAHLQRPTLY